MNISTNLISNAGVTRPGPNPPQKLEVPEWAQPQVDNFVKTGHLQGDSVNKRPLSEHQAGSMELEVGHEVLKAISIDETEKDAPGNGAFRVDLTSLGHDGTMQYNCGVDQTGEVVDGAAVLQRTSPNGTQAAVYAVFSEQATDVLQVVENGPTSLLHYDRTDANGSWLETSR